MFGSNVLEVAIGLVFVYLLLSLLCSTINEQVIARFFALRAKTLEEGITNMLANSQGKELVNQLYENPLIRGLSQNAASGKPRKPSYIPADTFALALMSTKVVQTYKVTPDAANNSIPAALGLLINNTKDDPAKVLANIEAWYNETMDRVSGWYKRRVQLIIFALGLVIAVGLNVDTISIITTLSNDSMIRSTIVSAAQGSANSPTNANLATLQKSIEQVQLVVGWSTSTLPADVWGWILKIVGLLATTFAVSLGAPFWFDLLNKFMAFRSSGPPPQARAGTAGSTSSKLQPVAGAGVSPNTNAQPVASTNGSTDTPK
jgi:hypothetical protein